MLDRSSCIESSTVYFYSILITLLKPKTEALKQIDFHFIFFRSALEAIGNNLQKQYERWQPRARYRQSLDPTVDEVRRLVCDISHFVFILASVKI